MSPFWQNIELLPSFERMRALREREQRTPEEYEESREKVKERIREGEEQKEEEKQLADVRLYLRLNEEELKALMQKENLQELLAQFQSYDQKQWSQMMQAFSRGHFHLSADATGAGKTGISLQLDLPEGNVTEKLLLNQTLQEALIARARRTDSS